MSNIQKSKPAKWSITTTEHAQAQKTKQKIIPTLWTESQHLRTNQPRIRLLVPCYNFTVSQFELTFHKKKNKENPVSNSHFYYKPIYWNMPRKNKVDSFAFFIFIIPTFSQQPKRQ